SHHAPARALVKLDLTRNNPVDARKPDETAACGEGHGIEGGGDAAVLAPPNQRNLRFTVARGKSAVRLHALIQVTTKSKGGFEFVGLLSARRVSAPPQFGPRSEERRVGKEARSLWAPSGAT